MREININIEGYNVNGICVGCLNYNRKMFYCEEIKECFKLLADIEVRPFLRFYQYSNTSLVIPVGSYHFNFPILSHVSLVFLCKQRPEQKS